MTVLGAHSIDETQRLMKTVEFRIKGVNKISGSITRERAEQEPTVYLDLMGDWTRFLQRWASTRDAVGDVLLMKKLQEPLAPASLIPSEPEYKQVRKAINVSGDDTFTRGDLPDLLVRFQRFSKENFDNTNAPIPDGFDPDLAVYKKLDSAIKSGETAAAAAKASVKDAAKSNMGLLVGIGAVAVVGGIVAVKVYL